MKIRYLFAALALGCLPLTAAKAVDVSISIAPPPIEIGVQPACPTEGYLWTPGYWAYDYGNSNYYWVGGVWVAPPRIGFLWTPGYWGFGDGFYAFHSGYWGPTIGFYGGINYGYGYGGYGYYGGRWEGRSFRYNTAITHVNVNVVHNTYEDRNFHDATNNHASFNGQGGIGVRPDSKQLAAARGSHLESTAAQTAAFHQATTTGNHVSDARTAGRNHGATGVTPDGRTTDLRKNAQTSPNSRSFTNNTRTGGRTNHTNLTRSGGSGRNRTTYTRGGVGRSQGGKPQIAHQSKGPQPHNNGGGKKDKKH